MTWRRGKAGRGLLEREGTTANGAQLVSYGNARHAEAMAIMLPRMFPHDLRKKPQLVGEADVFYALQGLDDDWAVFYDQPVKGSRRRVDFLCLNRMRGVVAIEVKGGQVHAFRGWFRQKIKVTGQRKRVDPFGQVKRGVRDVLVACDVSPERLPVAFVIAFPHMGAKGLPWRDPGPHIWTREIFEAGAVAKALAAMLPGGAVDATAVDAIQRIWRPAGSD